MTCHVNCSATLYTWYSKWPFWSEEFSTIFKWHIFLNFNLFPFLYFSFVHVEMFITTRSGRTPSVESYPLSIELNWLRTVINDYNWQKRQITRSFHSKLIRLSKGQVLQTNVQRESNGRKRIPWSICKNMYWNIGHLMAQAHPGISGFFLVKVTLVKRINCVSCRYTRNIHL